MKPGSPYPQAGIHATTSAPAASSPAQQLLDSVLLRPSSPGGCQPGGARPDSGLSVHGLMSVLLPQQEALYMKGRELTPQLSQSSVLSLADSHTEFFDACEVLLSASSSENEVREAGSWE